METEQLGPAGPTAPPQRVVTLEEYAVGVDQINLELQRQSAAYGHFRDVLAQIDALVQNPQGERGQLPFVSVRFPTKGTTPGEMKVDMNMLDVEALPHFRPLFEHLTTAAGESLVAAWQNFHRVTDATRPIIAAAQASG